MTDKELVKLAAKAAGIEYPGGDHSIYNDGRIWDCNKLCWWNPLTDDGDALRLHVFCYQTYGTEYIDRFNAAFDEELSLNPSYATAGFRRAATMTAAEISKEIP